MRGSIVQARARARAQARVVLSALALTSSAGCAAGAAGGAPAAMGGGESPLSQAAGAPTAGVAPSPAPAALAPSGAGASRYASTAGPADRAALPRDPLREAIVADARDVARRMGLPPLEADARLDRAMNDLAHGLRGDDLPALEVVDFLLAHYGIIEPSPHLLLARASAGADAEVRANTRAQVAEVLKAAPVTRVGIGVDRAGDQMYVVVALQEKNLEIEPCPRVMAAGAVTVVAGKLGRRYAEPQVVVTAPDGTVRELAAPGSIGAPAPASAHVPAPRDGRFRCEIRCDAGAGRYQVEIAGVDVAGTAVLANFPLFCGVAPPSEAPRAVGVPQAGLNAADGERRMLALVNHDRAAGGLPPLRWDGKLAAVARAHSRDMAEHDFVAHLSPRTGSALDRAQRAGLQPTLIFENVGRAYSADEAETGFMASPGHRGNLLDRRATRIGIGIVLGKPVTGTTPLFVTQLLM